MGARYEQYRWWLLDGDLEIVSDGRVAGASLPAALRQPEPGDRPARQPRPTSDEPTL